MLHTIFRRNVVVKPFSATVPGHSCLAVQNASSLGPSETNFKFFTINSSLNLETTSISTQERMSCFPSMKLHHRESKWFAVDRESKLDNESSTLPIRAEFETCVTWHVVEIPIQTTTHLMSCRFQVLALQRRIQLVAWVQCSLPCPKKHQSPVWGWNLA